MERSLKTRQRRLARPQGAARGLAVMDGGAFGRKISTSVSAAGALAALCRGVLGPAGDVARGGGRPEHRRPLEEPPGWESSDAKDRPDGLRGSIIPGETRLPMTLSEADVPDMLSLIETT